jgi:hypothetical protein
MKGPKLYELLLEQSFLPHLVLNADKRKDIGLTLTRQRTAVEVVPLFQGKKS